MSLSQIKVNNQVVTNVDEMPIGGSDNLIKSGGLSDIVGKLVGEKNTEEVTGNGTNWAVLPAAAKNIILAKNVPHEIIIKSNEPITVPSGLEDNKRTFVIELRDINTNTLITAAGSKTSPEHINADDIISIPPLSVDTKLYFEGRWSSTTKIYLVVKEVFVPERVVYATADIVADNINAVLKIPDFRVFSNGKKIYDISNQDYAYSNFIITQTSGWSVYLKEDGTISSKPYYSLYGNELVIANINLNNSSTISKIASEYFNVKLSQFDITNYLKDEYLHYQLSYASIHFETGKIEMINPSLVIRE